MSTGLYARLSEFAPPGSAGKEPAEGQGGASDAVGQAKEVHGHFFDQITSEQGRQGLATADSAVARADQMLSMPDLQVSSDSAARNFTDRYDLHDLLLFDSKSDRCDPLASAARGSVQSATAKLDSLPRLDFEDTAARTS